MGAAPIALLGDSLHHTHVTRQDTPAAPRDPLSVAIAPNCHQHLAQAVVAQVQRSGLLLPWCVWACCCLLVMGGAKSGAPALNSCATCHPCLHAQAVMEVVHTHCWL